MRFRSVLRYVFVVLICVVVLVVPCFAAPTSPPFYGTCYAIGVSDVLGTVTVYLPVDRQSSFSYDSSGYLFNATSSTITGVIVDSLGAQYTFRCTSFSTAEYRPLAGSGYTYNDLFLCNISDTNLIISDSFPGSFDMQYVYYLIIIGILGVVLLCLLKSRR